MDFTLDAIFRSWSLDPWVVVPLVLTAGVYLRGWYQLWRRGSQRFGAAQLIAFLGGLTAVFLALCSPIDPFGSLLLQVHMMQHLLLMMVVPPLLWLGAPMLPLLRGLPVSIRRDWLGPFLRSETIRRCFRRLTHPVVAWVLFVAASWFWHVPQVYELALRSTGWHKIEHACFLVTGLLFWWPVIQPYPSRPQGSRWLLLPYLLLADVQNTALSALFTFSDRVIYPHYAAVPRLWGMSALDDQAVAGVLMWVPGSLAYLIPLAWIGCQLLFNAERGTRNAERSSLHEKGRIALTVLPLGDPSFRVPRSALRARFDLLRLPLLGRFLKWRHARLALQIPLLLLAVAIILDGLFGPQVAPLNLAGVLPWIHWRGFVVLGLLVAGNVFCMACPFMLPRTLARKWLSPQRRWPPWLRSKWLAVALLVLFFWAYEAFALWDSPWWTAWIVIGYFLAAFVIDACFRGAAFCKYVCPIGQFNFVQSLVSPLEVRVRDPAVCEVCTTKDCIRGSPLTPSPSPTAGGEGSHNKARGCELHLFQQRKSSNMDCTFCLDCIHACPHDNIGIEAVTPGAELWRDPQRSGVGRFSRRLDLAALVVLLVFAAFANAAGMVAPVVDWQDRLTSAFGLSNPVFVITTSLVGALLVVPLFLVGGTTAISRWWSGDTSRWLDVASRFSYALVPLGAGMWLSHYSFHLLTSADAAFPAVQRVAVDLGTPFIPVPDILYQCVMAMASWTLRLELLFLDLGLLLSLYAGYRIALDRHPRRAQALKALTPWAVLMLLLFVVGIWIVFQPMQMRGTMQMVG